MWEEGSWLARCKEGGKEGGRGRAAREEEGDGGNFVQCGECNVRADGCDLSAC